MTDTPQAQRPQERPPQTVEEAISAAGIEIAAIVREYWQASALDKEAPSLNRKLVARRDEALQAIATAARAEAEQGVEPHRWQAHQSTCTSAWWEGYRYATGNRQPRDLIERAQQAEQEAADLRAALTEIAKPDGAATWATYEAEIADLQRRNVYRMTIARAALDGGREEVTT